MSFWAGSWPPQKIAHRDRTPQALERIDEPVDGAQVRLLRSRRAGALVDLARARHDHHELAVPCRLVGLDVLVELARQLGCAHPGLRTRVEMLAVERAGRPQRPDYLCRGHREVTRRLR